MSGYREQRFYSPIHDSEIARLSMFDAQGREFFMLVPCDDGKQYREARKTALEAIVTAMTMRLDPGEVRYA